MARPEPLPVWDRKSQALLQEYLDDHPSTYETKPQRSLTAWLESQPLYDRIVAAVQHSRRSARKIDPFVKKHNIDMGEFEPMIYRSYAEFFTRRFRPGVRSFPSPPDEMGAFAEARYFGWEALAPDQEFPIKGHSLKPDRILGSAERAERYLGGPVILARLSPVDYHHVHYFDDGRTLSDHRLGESLWTLNWKALRAKPDILFRNERSIHFLGTQNFGNLAFVEVGAMTVGRILQIHPLDQPFRRGEEKSLFTFGGSAVVVFGERGRWRPCDDVLKNTQKGVETLVRLGDTIAAASGVSQRGERRKRATAA
jgi:phosphatidylserine decarboxylase